MRSPAKVYAAELEGIDAKVIEVEVDVNVGLHSFTIVGLADRATNEAKERVNSALKNSGVKPPTRENRKITVNLAPADVRKTGSQYDLAIAVGYLLATQQIREFDPRGKLFVGELSLEGTVKPINGALNIARLAARKHFSHLFVPEVNAAQAALVGGVAVIPVPNLTALIDHLEERTVIAAQPKTDFAPREPESSISLLDIKGQAHAKRALEVAAAGGHHLLMSGPPGAGKTMMAQAFRSILPPPTLDEAIEVTQIWSVAGLVRDNAFLGSRPFRSPHHTASVVSVIGGGTDPKPGEISLAHRGVLFLDELPEFRRDLLEALRQPLEAGEVHVARSKQTFVFPARFLLVAAMNPCPCGYFGDPERECKCSAYDVMRYQKKISGPLLDRIDIQIEVPRVALEALRAPRTSDGHDEESIFRGVIARARRAQAERFAGISPPVRTNADMTSRHADEFVRIDSSGERFLKRMLEGSLVSARSYYRILKIAQTIADLEAAECVTGDHLAEAYQYRVREKE